MHPDPDRLLFRNVRLLDPARGTDQPGSLLVEDGRIAAIDADVPTPEGAVQLIEGDGACLAPGLIDLRIEAREPGSEHLETIASAAAAAVAGGVTTACCLPNTEPVLDDVALVEFVARRAEAAGLARIRCHAALTRGLAGEQISEIGLLAAAGAIGFTDGVKPVTDARLMRRIMSYARTFDALVMQHPEEPSLAHGGAMNEGELAGRLGLSGIPVEAEVILLERDIRLAALTGCRYHAAHVSTAEALAVIRRAKDRGLAVTCDTSPPYFALNEVAVGDYRTEAKLSPPLRSEADRAAIVEGLRDGTIDAVASDHSPHDHDSKRLPFAQASFGAVGLETLLALLLSLVHGGALGLLPALALVTTRAADVLRLPQGRLEVGAPADLVLFDLGAPWVIRGAKFRSKSRNTPFEGRPVQGVVQATVVGGRIVYEAQRAAAGR